MQKYSDTREIQISQITPQQDAENREKVLSDQTYIGTFSWIRPDGEENYIEYTAAQLDINSRRFTIGIDHDITDHRRVERALLESEERYRSLFEGVSIGLYRTLPSGQILDANKADIDLLGYPDRNTFLTVNAKDIYVDPEVRDKKLIGINSNGFIDSEIQLRRYDGTQVWVHNIVKAVKDDQGNVLYYDGIIEDITERKQAEELQARLQQTSKMESIGRLAGGVAHDFNNMLIVIQGSTSLAMMDLNHSDPLYNRLKMIEDASDRANGLTRQLLAFSRKQIIEPKIINMNDVIMNLRKMLGRLIGEDIELQTLLDEDIVNINADPGQMEQIIINLAVNSRDAMTDGGKLTIETSNVFFDEGYCQMHPNTQVGNYVRMTISDTGHGMSQEIREHIFEPFFTTKKLGEGTGLGLATVYGIVKQHNGSIECYSEIGHGTVFKIYLPQTDEGEAINLMESEEPITTTGNEIILLVEDEDFVRDVASDFLRHLGYKVLIAESGKSAFTIAEQYNNTIHLLLTDVVMPGINGRELSEGLLRLHPEMKVLYTSGYTQNVIAHHGILEE